VVGEPLVDTAGGIAVETVLLVAALTSVLVTGTPAHPSANKDVDISDTSRKWRRETIRVFTSASSVTGPRSIKLITFPHFARRRSTG
jgi:hypothetical protein